MALTLLEAIKSVNVQPLLFNFVVKAGQAVLQYYFIVVISIETARTMFLHPHHNVGAYILVGRNSGAIFKTDFSHKIT